MVQRTDELTSVERVTQPNEYGGVTIIYTTKIGDDVVRKRCDYHVVRGDLKRRDITRNSEKSDYGGSLLLKVFYDKGSPSGLLADPTAPLSAPTDPSFPTFLSHLLLSVRVGDAALISTAFFSWYRQAQTGVCDSTSTSRCREMLRAAITADELTSVERVTQPNEYGGVTTIYTTRAGDAVVCKTWDFNNEHDDLKRRDIIRNSEKSDYGGSLLLKVFYDNGDDYDVLKPCESEFGAMRFGRRTWQRRGAHLFRSVR
ncbi:hypothetical protein R1flu_023198 [Riccia fluitans]|uniref:Uncharacterized protein n=1 Tax=Riccia fluitans TaxID=41844 RepID=A0ABD1XUA9_9MARC